MRNTHALTLSIKPKEKDGKVTEVLLMRHLIEAIVPQKEGCTILMNSGVAYEVIESKDVIINKGKSYGLINVV